MNMCIFCRKLLFATILGSVMGSVAHASSPKFFSLDAVRNGVSTEAIAAARTVAKIQNTTAHKSPPSHFKPLNRALLTPTRPVSAPQGVYNHARSPNEASKGDFMELARQKDAQEVFEEVHFEVANVSHNPAAAPRSLTHQMILSLFEPEEATMPTVGHQWPVAENVSQRISSPYGLRQHPFTGKESFHAGLDIAAAKGSDVFATADGIIEGVGTHPRLGKYVKVMHEDGFYSLYGHLESWQAEQGEAVKAGDVIGSVGSTGRSTGPHLDYSLRRDGQPIDPLLVLPVPESLQTVELSSIN